MGKGLAVPMQALGPEDGWQYLKGKDFGKRPRLKMAPREGTNSNLNPIKGICFGVFPSLQYATVT